MLAVPVGWLSLNSGRKEFPKYVRLHSERSGSSIAALMKSAEKKPTPTRAGGRRINLQDIAELAGVSVGAVSSVLNNRQVERRIPDATAEAIRQAAASMGYLPNINARRLRSGETVKNTVILALISSFEAPIPLVNHFVAALHAEAEKVVATTGRHTYSLMIEMFSAGRLRELPGLLTGHGFNAAIIMNTIAEDDEFLAGVRLPYPVVLINRVIASLPCVVEDDGSGGRVAELFQRKNRVRPAVLHGEPMTQTTRQRVRCSVSGPVIFTARIRRRSWPRPFRRKVGI